MENKIVSIIILSLSLSPFPFEGELVLIWTRKHQKRHAKQVKWFAMIYFGQSDGRKFLFRNPRIGWELHSPRWSFVQQHQALSSKKLWIWAAKWLTRKRAAEWRRKVLCSFEWPEVRSNGGLRPVAWFYQFITKFTFRFWAFF